MDRKGICEAGRGEVSFSTGKGVVTSSLMSMRRARPHGNERSLAIRPYLLPDADSMQFVRPATKGASEVKWYGPEPQPFKCILVNGSAPMQARAMVTIVTNSPQLSNPSPPTCSTLLSHQKWPWSVSMDNMVTRL